MARRTIADLKELINLLPDDLEVQFSPITSAYLGANDPLTLDDFHIYDESLERKAPPSEPGAIVVFQICEDPYAKGGERNPNSRQRD